MERSRLIGLGIGLVGAVVGIAVGVYFLFFAEPSGPDNSFPPLRPGLDAKGGYLILASERAEAEYAQAMALAREMHPDAQAASFTPMLSGDADAMLDILRTHNPRYVMIFVQPDELDANLAWEWLKLSTRVDDDPFVDLCTGYITGQTPQDALAFVTRIRDAAQGKLVLPGAMVDHLAANPMAQPDMFQKGWGSFFLPAFQKRMFVTSISCGARGFGRDKLDSMDEAGILHFGGHGFPDGIVDTLNGVYVRQLKISPSIVFNGACYTGVIGKWFDVTTGSAQERTVQPEASFCMGMLQNNAVAYLAALHADHGLPVYQEMEFMAFSGGSLGRVMKNTYDGLVLANGGVLPDFPGFEQGRAVNWSLPELMLFGTGTRVLFGDPAFVAEPAFADPPFALQSSRQGEELRAVFTLNNPLLRATYTDTYFADMSYSEYGFNDRALLIVPLPQGWEGAQAEVVDVQGVGGPLRYEVKGQAVEHWGGQALLHVQLDFAATNYMQSEYRKGCTITLRVVKTL